MLLPALAAYAPLALFGGPAVLDDTGPLRTELEPTYDAPEVLFELAPLHFPLTAGIRVADVSFDTGEPSTTRVRIDKNGDGKLDQTVKGDGDPVKLSIPRDGGAIEHAVGLMETAGYWTWRSMGLRKGSVLGEPVWILDRDANGRFDDDGDDVVVLGTKGTACLLADVMWLGEDWFEVQVDEDGTSLALRPYAGELGAIDALSGWDSRADLDQAVFLSDRGAASFDVVELGSEAEVPVGDYELTFGRASKGSKSLRIDLGRMHEVRVRTQRPVLLEWGGPAYGTVSVDHDVGKVSIAADVKLYGHAGEEYVGFMPYIKTPPGYVLYDATKKKKKLGKGSLCPT